MMPAVKSLLVFTMVWFACLNQSKAQIVVNPDGTHSVVTGNIVVNPNGTHSVIHGNILVNSDGTHSIMHNNQVLPVTAPTNLLRKSNGSQSQSMGFDQWFIQLFSKKDKAEVKRNKESQQRARGKISGRRFTNPR